jgi:hypothetical protein
MDVAIATSPSFSRKALLCKRSNRVCAPTDQIHPIARAFDSAQLSGRDPENDMLGAGNKNAFPEDAASPLSSKERLPIF